MPGMYYWAKKIIPKNCPQWCNGVWPGLTFIIPRTPVPVKRTVKILVYWKSQWLLAL